MKDCGGGGGGGGSKDGRQHNQVWRGCLSLRAVVAGWLENQNLERRSTGGDWGSHNSRSRLTAARGGLCVCVCVITMCGG